MYKFFTDKHITRFINRGFFLYFNRLKSETSNIVEITINHSNSKRLEESHSKLFQKILNHKNERRKEQMVKIYIKMVEQSKLRSIHVDYLLKSKLKKQDAEQNIQIIEHKQRLNKYFSNNAIIQSEETNSEKNVINPDIPRPKRREPGKVIWGFIPEEWADFFVPVTGHSGFYTFLTTFGTYLFSKEIYVCDHEFYNGLSMIILCVYVIKTKGQELARYLDKEVDQYELKLNENLKKMKADIKYSIALDLFEQDCMDGQLLLIEAKRENVHLQQEAEFRKRQMEVYENVKRILDYHVAVAEVKRKIQHKNLVQWVVREVEKNLTPELKEQYEKFCIADLHKMLKVTET